MCSGELAVAMNIVTYIATSISVGALEFVSSGGVPIPANIIGIWVWRICGLMGGAFIT